MASVGHDVGCVRGGNSGGLFFSSVLLGHLDVFPDQRNNIIKIKASEPFALVDKGCFLSALMESRSLCLLSIAFAVDNLTSYKLHTDARNTLSMLADAKFRNAGHSNLDVARGKLNAVNAFHSRSSFAALHMLFVKLNQLRADTKPWVLNGTASDIRDGGLGAFALLRKLYLRHASGHKLVDKKFPVHADDYRATDIHCIGYPMNGSSTLLP